MLYIFEKRFFLIIAISICSSCFTIRTYEDKDGPAYVSNDKGYDRKSDSLTILTFNIKKSENIDVAIAELKSFNQKIPVDIYLLQEMDSNGVQAIAKQFGLNYLYIPIAYNTLIKKDVGNAILTRGQISIYEKLILPNKKWKNGRKRHSTIGEIIIDEKKVLVYSIHTETSSMSRKKRLEQLNAIIEHGISQSAKYKYIIAGGDFNTLYKKDVDTTIQKFREAGFDCVTDSVGYTAKAMLGTIKPSLDFIFSKGFTKIDAGKISESESSDHLPVFGIVRK